MKTAIVKYSSPAHITNPFWIKSSSTYALCREGWSAHNNCQACHLKNVMSKKFYFLRIFLIVLLGCLSSGTIDAQLSSRVFEKALEAAEGEEKSQIKNAVDLMEAGRYEKAVTL